MNPRLENSKNYESMKHIFKSKSFTKTGNGCSHNLVSQKGHWTIKKENQNYRNIYVVLLKTM